MDPDVLGYISQCELCGQRVITKTGHGDGYECRRCLAVTHATDDAPDLRKVRG